MLEEVEDKFGESHARWFVALLYQDRGDLQKAKSELERAIALGEKTQNPKLELMQQRLMALEKLISDQEEDA